MGGFRAKDGAAATKSGSIRDPRLRWYPPSWRARYGEELSALLDEEFEGRLPVSAQLNLVANGLRQRARQSGLVGDAVSSADGIRSGALLVLASWTAFVVAGASFAKFSEHFDQALPRSSGSHRVALNAFTALQVAAGAAGFLVLLGAVLAVPALVRYLRATGLSALRGHLVRALVATTLTVAATVAVVTWAHQLTAIQRNSGLHWYGAVFVLWAVLVAITLALWTAVAIALGRRLELSAAVLKTEALLSAVVAGAMAAMLGATAVWWAAMAEGAPGFLRASPAGAPGSSWDIVLVTTVLLMVLATIAASLGVAREVRTWSRMQAHKRSD